ncbi:AVAST type 3 anti-phage nuclease/ATPase Avs3a [Achromobacter xylosoxidans]|uniref:AVAST type 3 anti-phage nuclease/ATPase Avs3a n=1 Tax=Alcaligenes xylosoxydans xylosoxydans TaxID=85698 RepID=UPI0022B91350|nr:AVAST type 3 anti-phage nuclease/ATPase Avs3a [Achromobacter xylosoxidans]MCZ8441857.1 ATP-binding protein [Achromobacter xylosoxidans]
MAKQGSVGPSRSGDQFHYQWAARQCLGLLTRENGLVAVAIEGASLDEGDASTSIGDEAIDVGLYYGSEDVTAATSIRYVQLKHSSRQAHTPWTASGLRETIEGFAGRFKKLEASLGLGVLAKTVRFVFLTNRPMDGAVLEALADIASGSTVPRHREIDELLKRYAASAGSNAQSFFAAFSVEAGEPDLWEQRNLLSQDLSAYLSQPDTEAALQLKELVVRRATDEGRKNRSVRLYDVLRALHVTEVDLLPAPSLISEPKQMLPRAQQADILAALLTAQRPVVIHADGGVGKSTLSAYLARAMPAGSVAVLYDCFGDGTYRQALKYRHRYRDALVQIVNELSGQQLCLPLIPSGGTDPKQFMQAFISRLKQAMDLVRARTPQASLCIIVDAADNAYMAAQEIGERPFVHDLINTDMPDGVRLAFTCRSHRKSYLRAPLDAIMIKLESFSKAETATHLRLSYPEATDAEAAEFAFLSSDNPRVQALAMEGTPLIDDMIRALGPMPTTIQRAIGGLLKKSIDRLKAEWGPTEANQIDLICKGLAVLRPLVPISILAQIAGVSESAVRTFATEFGRPLFVKDSGLHFTDEPAETWFNETFKPDAASLDAFLSKLKPLAATSSYAAAALPQLLLSAGRMDELIALALSNESLPEFNPLERRDVELQRLMFALRACLQQGRYVAAAKLALKVGGEVAGEARQNTLIRNNTDIASVLLAADRIEEMVSRRTFAGGFLGSHHAYEAVLLAGSDDLIPEARSRLRMAWESLIAWSKLPPKRRKEDKIDDADVAELAIGLLRLRGPARAAQFLKAWNSKSTVLGTTKRVAARLADVGDFKGIDELAEHAEGDAWMMLGLASESARVAHLLSTEPLRQLMGILVDPKVKLPEENLSWRSGSNVLDGVSSAITLALRCLPRDDATWAETLRRYLPLDPPRQSYDFDAERETIIRAYALEAALRGERIELIDLAPKDIRPEFEAKGSPAKSQQASQLQQVTGGVLPWFILAAEIACGRPPLNLDHEIELALGQTKSASSRDYQRNFNLEKVAAVEWVRILRDAGPIQSVQVDALLKWVEKNDRIYSSTFTRMCHIAARTAGLGDLSLRLSSKAFDQFAASRSDAETQVDDLQGLARAIFCVSRSEAAAYFDKAIDIASKIGEEHLSRWTTFLDLTDAAHRPDEARPRTAYRLARIAELSYEHMARDKYMDWDRLVKGLVGLCPSSSLAILSRWRDREFGFAGELFPIAIYSLIDHGFLPKKAAVALSGTVKGWKRVHDIKAAIDAESDDNRKRSILRVAYRFLRIQAYEAPTWRELKALANSLAMSLPDLERLLQTSEAKAGNSATAAPALLAGPHKELDGPDWDAIFSGVDLRDSAAVITARRSLKKVGGRSYASEFYRQGCRRATLSEIEGYLRAIQSDDRFNVFTFMDVIRHLPEASKGLLSVRNELKKATLSLAASEPNRVGRRGWGHEGPFDGLYAEGIVLERDVASARIKGYLSQLDTLDANELFHLVDPLTRRLTSDEADEVLNFGFDLLEEIFEAEDGDGPWNDSLAPSSSCEEALAGYLWAGLARPATAERWEHAHCVRNCLELDWQSLLSALATRALGADPQPFVDRRLVFYEWHARQWLCLALARGAMDAPRAVSPFLAFLDAGAREQHVVIRHFASDALKRLNEVNALPTDLLAIANGANRPALDTEIYARGEHEIVDDDVSDGEAADDDERYFFGIDIGPYWFAPLGRVFGLKEQSIERRARAVLRGRMSLGPGRRVDDQRYKRGLFRGKETTHSHSSMPEVEDSVAYQSYHAMMFVAGLLLNTKPVRRRANEDENPFDDWLKGQLLTRDDDRWLADRRDPEILKADPSSSARSDASWCWQIDRHYLDEQLTTDDGMTALWGHWTTTDAVNGETVSVSSVLVPSRHAAAFLAAMQTSPNPGEIYFPDADHIDHREEVEDPELRLLGWVKAGSDSLSLDEYDPWAGKVSHPGPRPCQEILNVLKPMPDPDARSWTLPAGGRLRSESWSRSTGYGEDRDVLTGTRLSADDKFIHALLDGYPNTSLIVCVNVRRKPPKDETGHDDYSFYHYPYNRYYLIGHDGITRSL